MYEEANVPENSGPYPNLGQPLKASARKGGAGLEKSLQPLAEMFPEFETLAQRLEGAVNRLGGNVPCDPHVEAESPKHISITLQDKIHVTVSRYQSLLPMLRNTADRLEELS